MSSSIDHDHNEGPGKTDWLTRHRDAYLDELGRLDAHVACRGKGRKGRATPVRADTVKVLRDWLDERSAAGDGQD